MQGSSAFNTQASRAVPDSRQTATENFPPEAPGLFQRLTSELLVPEKQAVTSPKQVNVAISTGAHPQKSKKTAGPAAKHSNLALLSVKDTSTAKKRASQLNYFSPREAGTVQHGKVTHAMS